MQSETFKLLMEKQKTKSNEDKSEEPKSDVKEYELTFNINKFLERYQLLKIWVKEELFS